MNNQEKAARILMRHWSGLDVPDDETTCCAQELADAGLLAPDEATESTAAADLARVTKRLRSLRDFHQEVVDKPGMWRDEYVQYSETTLRELDIIIGGAPNA